MDDLTEALVDTGATIAFDAIGGGKLAGQILTAHGGRGQPDAAKAYSRYGSTVHKQVYIYGGLDHAADRARPHLRHGLGRRRLAADPVPAEDRRATAPQRCASAWSAELKTTFASHYTQVISLHEALSPRAHRRLQQARDRREVPDRSEQGV